jgi:hypothetical protein
MSEHLNTYDEPKYYWVDVPTWYDTNLNQPSWWDNFEQHCLDIWDKSMNQADRWHIYTIMNYELKPYGAKYKHRNTQSSIRFNDESGFTMFLLRWA